jgi:small ligand-binding sensory domain FIST
VKNLVTKDERKVILRTSGREDLDDLQELIDFLTEERAQIVRDEKIS